jgi:hypothetical protein
MEGGVNQAFPVRPRDKGECKRVELADQKGTPEPNWDIDAKRVTNSSTAFCIGVIALILRETA